MPSVNYKQWAIGVMRCPADARIILVLVINNNNYRNIIQPSHRIRTQQELEFYTSWPIKGKKVFHHIRHHQHYLLSLLGSLKTNLNPRQKDMSLNW